MQHEVTSILDGYLTLEQTAAELGIHLVTLKRWKARRYGPKPVRVGGRVYYKRDDWRAFLEGATGPKGSKGGRAA